MILLAAFTIAYTAIERLINPAGLTEVGIGLAISLAATLINLGAATLLMRTGRQEQSLTLEADGRHLMTDVWTSAGVVVGVALVWVTGWLWLDPVIAIAVALNIVWTGWQLMHRSAEGLMDVSLPEEKEAEIEAVLKPYREQGLDFHALRTRQAGSRAFVSVHVLVPGQWTVKEAHDWAERIERDIRKVMPRVNAMTHLEPLEDPASMLDQDLDRLHC